MIKLKTDSIMPMPQNSLIIQEGESLLLGGMGKIDNEANISKGKEIVGSSYKTWKMRARQSEGGQVEGKSETGKRKIWEMEISAEDTRNEGARKKRKE